MIRIKTLLSIFIITCFLLLNACKSKQASLGNSLNGSWSGEAYQYNINETWSIDFLCNRKEKIYSIHYPSLGCGGSWNLEQQYNNTFEFREVLDNGFYICNDRGKVVLEMKNHNTIAFSYYWPDDKTLNASGYLKKN